MSSSPPIISKFKFRDSFLEKNAFSKYQMLIDWVINKNDRFYQFYSFIRFQST